MRKTLDSINYLNLQSIKKEGLIYIPYKTKIHIYHKLENGKLDKQREIDNQDEILNFHFVNHSEGNLIIISKYDKRISLWNSKFEKVKET
jgi:hypothetical protein